MFSCFLNYEKSNISSFFSGDFIRSQHKKSRLSRVKITNLLFQKLPLLGLVVGVCKQTDK